MKRRNLLQLGGGLAALGLAQAGAAGHAAAQAKLVLKTSDVHPPGYPTVVAIEAMGKKLSAATNGRISVEMFPSMQLGGEKEAVEQTQIGALQMSRVSVGMVGSLVDDLNVFNLPFLFRSPEHMDKVIDGPIGQQLLDEVTNAPNSHLVGLAFMDAGARSMYDTKHPIRTIDDMKGLKVRVMGNPIFVDMANALGANAVPMGYDQVFSALQTGVIDGAENNQPSFVFDNHYQVAKYFTKTEHLIVPEIVVFSRVTWDKLSPADQALIRKLAREAQLEERVLWNQSVQAAEDKMKAAGIVEISLADKTPYQKAVKPVWDKYGAKWSDLINRIQAVQ